jgi:crotonobetainyl-CoA hydratase
MTSTTTPDEPLALYERTGHIALVTLNRPRALNSVNSALSDAVGTLLEQANDDPEVRVIVVTGNGRAFCAGADLKELAAGRSVQPTKDPSWGFAGIVNHWIDKPIIAAVNGYAMGGGTEIVLACDLVVAAEDVSLGLPEVKRGLLAAGGGVVRLQRQVPIKRALELALTGDPIDAATAASWGLVNVVAPVGEAVTQAMVLAERVAVNAPLSIQATKRVIYETATGGSDWDPAWSGSDGWQVNEAARNRVFATHDAHEGATAFAEKRTPVWLGR